MPIEAYLHSEIQEIMVSKASFALKWGNLLIASLVVVLLVFVGWFQYPEFITTDVSIIGSKADPLPAAEATSGSALQIIPYRALGTITREQYPFVRKGQAVLVRLHELGDVTLYGNVYQVAPQADHYRHQIVIELASTKTPRLYPSFSGNARIILQRQSLLRKFLSLPE